MEPYFITLRGTGETHKAPQSMFGQITRRMGKIRAWFDLNYPASVGLVNSDYNPFGPSLQESIRRGVEMLSEAVEDLARLEPDTPLVVGGYSLGALAVNEWMRSAPSDQLDAVDRVVLLANPARPMGATEYAPACHWSGIASDLALESYPLDVFNVAHSEDAITNVSPKSPLRNIVPWLYALDIDVPGVWFNSISSQVKKGTLVRAPIHLLDKEWRAAASRTTIELYRYAFGGTHTADYLKSPRWSNGRNAAQVVSSLVTGGQ